MTNNLTVEKELFFAICIKDIHMQVYTKRLEQITKVGIERRNTTGVNETK